MIRLKDIADKAGVGLATVSRYINGNGYVSEDAGEKIQNAMEALGYGEKKKKKGSGEMNLVGVVVPYLEHPFFGSMLQYLETELRTRGYQVVVFSERGMLARQEEALQLLFTGELDGMINFGNMPVGFNGRTGKPLLSFDRSWSKDVPLVRTNHLKGGRMAAEEFIKRGKKKIVFFVGGQDLTRSANIRYMEAKSRIEELGGQVTVIFTDWDALSYQYNKQITGRYRELLLEADGCFTTDVGSICCQLELQKLGVRIPEDFMVISYDGTGLVDICTPSIPTICQDGAALAKECSDVLEKMMRGDCVESTYEVDPYWKNL